jgi:hypothetical protein
MFLKVMMRTQGAEFLIQLIARLYGRRPFAGSTWLADRSNCAAPTSRFLAADQIHEAEHIEIETGSIEPDAPR